jgi:hypothetical protein
MAEFVLMHRSEPPRLNGSQTENPSREDFLQDLRSVNYGQFAAKSILFRTIFRTSFPAGEYRQLLTGKSPSVSGNEWALA